MKNVSAVDGLKSLAHYEKDQKDCKNCDFIANVIDEIQVRKHLSKILRLVVLFEKNLMNLHFFGNM